MIRNVFHVKLRFNQLILYTFPFNITLQIKVSQKRYSFKQKQGQSWARTVRTKWARTSWARTSYIYHRSFYKSTLHLNLHIFQPVLLHDYVARYSLCVFHYNDWHQTSCLRCQNNLVQWQRYLEQHIYNWFLYYI